MMSHSGGSNRQAVMAGSYTHSPPSTKNLYLTFALEMLYDSCAVMTAEPLVS